MVVGPRQVDRAAGGNDGSFDIANARVIFQGKRIAQPRSVAPHGRFVFAVGADWQARLGEYALERRLAIHQQTASARTDEDLDPRYVVHRGQLVVEVYHSRVVGPVPHEEDVVATATRSLADFDIDDERSLTAAVRDAVAAAQPVPRPAR